MSTYFSIETASKGYFEDKASKFHAYAFPCYNEDSFKAQLAEVQSLHPKASHHCYAYRIGTDKNNFRANDDGEPSGSAGKPILGQIDSFELSNVFIVVVRYYGGVNLGVSGLINAYKKAAQDALTEAHIVEKEIQSFWMVSCPYTQVNDLFNYLKRRGVDQWSEDYSAHCKISFQLPRSSTEEVSLWLRTNEMKFEIVKEL